MQADPEEIDVVDPVEDGSRVEHHLARDAGRTLRGVTVGLVLAVLIALAVDDEVTVGWVFGEADVPRALVVATSAVAGALVGWLVLHRPGRNAEHRRPVGSGTRPALASGSLRPGVDGARQDARRHPQGSARVSTLRGRDTLANDR